jgi:thioredoxin-related protein
MKLTRRHLLAAGALAAPALHAAGRAVATPLLGDDGLYKQDWFLQSFLELGPDLEDAAADGRRLAVVWELSGCPYCKDMHLVNFADPTVRDFIRERFALLQLNLVGNLEVEDFDGTRLAEKDLAARYGIRFTPTIQFFPERVEGLAALPPREREVARLIGYQPPDPFRRIFAYVAERAYEHESLEAYLARTA